MNKEKREFETPEAITSRVLGRYSILDLRELSDDDMQRGEARQIGAVKIIKQGTTNFIEWFVVESEGACYEVRRFMTFHFCTCRHFFFNKSACKHIAAITEPKCSRCGKAAPVRGTKCAGCAMDTAIYNKASKPVEKIGGMRI